jgi:uncharacterized DUF497 family protein
VVHERQFEFEWDPRKAAANVSKHNVAFEAACTVDYDPLLLTVADMEHSHSEERWFSIGRAGTGMILASSISGPKLILRLQRSE